MRILISSTSSTKFDVMAKYCGWQSIEAKLWHFIVVHFVPFLWIWHLRSIRTWKFKILSLIFSSFSIIICKSTELPNFLVYYNSNNLDIVPIGIEQFLMHRTLYCNMHTYRMPSSKLMTNVRPYSGLLDCLICLGKKMPKIEI